MLLDLLANINYVSSEWVTYKDNFINDLSKARTYTLYEDIEKMRTAGLAIGGNLNNAIVVDKYKILNPEGLRLEKEFVKHKTLDCIGDFYLLGMQLVGNIECYAPGHNLNQQLIREILKNRENYRIEEITPENNNKNFLDLIDNNLFIFSILPNDSFTDFECSLSILFPD